MNENAPTGLTFINSDGIVLVPIMDCSVAQILRMSTSKGFRQPFIDNPYLEQTTLRQVVSSPFAMSDFLRCCRLLPHCGEVTINRLCAVIESVAAGIVDQNSGVCRVTTR